MFHKVPVFVVDVLSPRTEFLHGRYSPCTGIVLKNSLASLFDTPTFSSFGSSIRFIIGIIVHSPSLSAMNSASIVLYAVSDCIFEPQVTGHPAYMIMNPVLHFAVALSRCAFS